MTESSDNPDERRLWIGNLDTRMSEFQLLKIVQTFGSIEKFDMLFHKSGPQKGQPRGYAFVTYKTVRDAHIALDKMHGQLIEKRPLVVRLAKNINYDLLEKPKPKIEIPALAAGSSTTEKITVSKGITVEAIEAKLRVLEQRRNDLEINKNQSNEPPLIQKYQYNKTNDNNSKYSSTKLVTQSRYQRNQRHKNSGPYNRRGRR